MPTDEKLKFTMIPATATILPFKVAPGTEIMGPTLEATPGVTPEVTPSDPNTADKRIVKLFEDYLEKARRGEIMFAAIASVQNGIAYSTWEPEKSTPQIISTALGSVSYLNHRFNRACDEGADYDSSDNPPPDLA